MEGTPEQGTPFGRYRLIELLGRGGMGEVWKAHDTAIDRVVALKMLLPAYAKDPDFEQRFRREARAAARLDDPHVVPIYDVGEIDDRLYVTMRLINGTDLQTLIDARPLEPKRAVAIIDQIASALNNAHTVGLVHRDVKPSNILVDANDYAYLIDFGIARAANDTRLTSASSAIGTWAYMAPERFSSGDVHPSSDVYALACVLYQCLTGQQPFPGSTLEQVAVGHMVTPPPKPSERAPIPSALDQVIATGLAKQPADRYATTVEMASAAREAVTGADPSSSVAAPQAHAPGNGRGGWPEEQFTHVSNTPVPYPATSPTQFGGPRHVYRPPMPPPPVPQPQPPVKKGSGGRHGVLIGALVFIGTLIIVGGVVAVIAVTRHDDTKSAKPSNAAANGVEFSGTYRVDYGPGTDLDDKPVPNAPATTGNWDIRSQCGAAGCVATAASASGNALLSNMTFDQLGGTWVAVGLASAQCGTPDPVEIWVVMTLQPHPDGTLSGDTIRASTNSACAAKRTVKFTRTGDPDPNKVADPAVVPPRGMSPAGGLRGSYRETTTFADGTVLPPKVLDVTTYCLRTGDRCMSLFHAGGEVVTLMFADDKWTRDEQGNQSCPAGAAQVKITAEYPMPQTLDDPISVLSGRGTQTILPGSPCTGGGDFQDRFERTGD